MTRQEYDKNTIQLKGVISKVYRRDGDVFALVVASSAIGARTRALLRIEQGRIDDKVVSVKSGKRVQVLGYLYPEEYAISLMTFLQYAQALELIDKLPKEDLPEWTKILLTYNNPAVHVLAMADLDNDNQVIKAYGAGFDTNLKNQVMIEGIVAKLWDYPPTAEGQRYLRLAVYDEHCVSAAGLKSSGNGKLPRQKAHYYNAMIPDEEKDSVKEHGRLLLEGSLEQYSQRVTLRKALEHTNLNGNLERLIQRLEKDDWLDQAVLSRRVNYIHAHTVTVYDR